MTIDRVLAIDGSGAKSARAAHKRPIYRLTTDSGAIERLQATASFLDLLERELAEAAPERQVLVAVDVALGLPDGYPEVYGANGFVEWLRQLGRDDWRGMVAEGVDDQRPDQPFVEKPQAGDKRRGRFPWRRCDRLVGAESLYWCMGPRQVGKAALQFWFEVLRPLLKDDDVAVWPFHDLSDARLIVAECYPGCLTKRVWGRSVVKTNPSDVVAALDASADARRATSERTRLHAASSEDEFDMMTVSLALRQAFESGVDFLSAPADARPVEGWILLTEDAQ